MIKKYIKKPITVEAVQWNGDNLEEMKQIIKPFVFANNCEDRHNFIADGDETGDSIYFTGFFNYGFSNLRLPINHYLIIKRNEKNIDCLLSTCDKKEFAAEYEQQDSNHTSKSSGFSLRDLVLQIAPKHIKYYIKRLEEYGFKLYSVSDFWFSDEEAHLPFISLEDKNGNSVIIANRSRPHDYENHTAFVFSPCTSRCERTEIEVKNNNWRAAFNELVASFPDEIKKNTNHHASLTL